MRQIFKRIFEYFWVQKRTKNLPTKFSFNNSAYCKLRNPQSDQDFESRKVVRIPSIQVINYI